MYNIAICDDDLQSITYLSKKTANIFPASFRLMEFHGWFSLSSYLEDTRKAKLDILLLDINLGTKNGIDLAREFLHQFPNIKVIFVSGYCEYAQEIFYASPVWFLLKPVKESMLLSAFNKAIQKIKEDTEQTFVIHTRGIMTKILFRKIQYFASSEHVVSVYFVDEMIEFHQKLDEVAKTLPPEFIRCHKSFLVNMNHIRLFDVTQIQLYNGQTIPISRAYKKSAKELYQAFICDQY